MNARKCNECTLCCKLLPVLDIAKPANTKCKHQNHKGCGIYLKRPISCRIWKCVWLLEPSVITRPDKSHYVIDPSPDYVELTSNGESAIKKVRVIQVWVDPKYPKAHEDPELRAWLEKWELPALIRFNSSDSIAIFPPSITGKGWVEMAGTCREQKL